MRKRRSLFLVPLVRRICFFIRLIFPVYLEFVARKESYDRQTDDEKRCKHDIYAMYAKINDLRFASGEGITNDLLAH